MNDAFQKYKKTSIQSASKEKLLLLMYEGAIRFVKQAMIACDKNEIAERGLNIGKAYDVIMELNNTLNHDVGGEIAKNLEQLYLFMTERLTRANVSGNRAELEPVLRVLETLHSGWVEAIEKIKRGDTASR